MAVTLQVGTGPYKLAPAIDHSHVGQGIAFCMQRGTALLFRRPSLPWVQAMYTGGRMKGAELHMGRSSHHISPDSHTTISGQNTNDKMQWPKTPIQKMLASTPKPQTPNPKHINQWHFMRQRFVRGILTGYPIAHLPSWLTLMATCHIISWEWMLWLKLATASAPISILWWLLKQLILMSNFCIKTSISVRVLLRIIFPWSIWIWVMSCSSHEKMLLALFPSAGALICCFMPTLVTNL